MSAKGGITKGKSHKEGGIPMVVKSTGQKVELEGGEGVINKRNMADTKTHTFDGKEMTKCEVASAINSDGGNGVEIDCSNIVGKKYKYGVGGTISETELQKGWEWDVSNQEHKTLPNRAIRYNKKHNRYELYNYTNNETDYSYSSLDDLVRNVNNIMGETFKTSKNIGGYLAIASQMKDVAPETMGALDRRASEQISSSPTPFDKGGYMVFNYTDNIYASPNTFQTFDQANEFIKVFRNRYNKQGYYRDNNWNKISPQDIDLVVLEENFRPFEKGGEVESEWNVYLSAYDFDDDDEYGTNVIVRATNEQQAEARAKQKFLENNGLHQAEFNENKTTIERMGSFAKGGERDRNYEWKKKADNFLKYGTYYANGGVVKVYEAITNDNFDFDKGSREWHKMYLDITPLVWARNMQDGYKIDVYSERYGEHLGTIDVDYNREPRTIITYDKNQQHYFMAKGGSVSYDKMNNVDSNAYRIIERAVRGRDVSLRTKGDKIFVIDERNDKIYEYDKSYNAKQKIEDFIDKLKSSYAKGGALSQEFKFDKNFIIYVPSTTDVGTHITKKQLDKRVKQVKDYVANVFGGYTETETDGGYKTTDGDIVEEDIIKVSVFAKRKDWKKNETKIVEQIRKWGKEWGQEAIGFEFEGDLYYVDDEKKFKVGGDVQTEFDDWLDTNEYDYISQTKWGKGGNEYEHSDLVAQFKSQHPQYKNEEIYAKGGEVEFNGWWEDSIESDKKQDQYRKKYNLNIGTKLYPKDDENWKAYYGNTPYAIIDGFGLRTPNRVTLRVGRATEIVSLEDIINNWKIVDGISDADRMEALIQSEKYYAKGGEVDGKRHWLHPNAFSNLNKAINHFEHKIKEDGWYRSDCNEKEHLIRLKAHRKEFLDDDYYEGEDKDWYDIDKIKRTSPRHYNLNFYAKGGRVHSSPSNMRIFKEEFLDKATEVTSDDKSITLYFDENLENTNTTSYFKANGLDRTKYTYLKNKGFFTNYYDKDSGLYIVMPLEYFKDRTIIKKRLSKTSYAKGGKINDHINSLKKGDTIKIKFGSPISKNNEVELEVRSRNKVKKGTIDKITFVNKSKPTSVKYYAYNRGKGWSFAKGDMAIFNIEVFSKGGTIKNYDSIRGNTFYRRQGKLEDLKEWRSWQDFYKNRTHSLPSKSIYKVHNDEWFLKGHNNHYYGNEAVFMGVGNGNRGEGRLVLSDIGSGEVLDVHYFAKGGTTKLMEFEEVMDEHFSKGGGVKTIYLKSDFGYDKGNLPQIRSSIKDQFIKYLTSKYGQNIVSSEKIEAKLLKPIQKEVNVNQIKVIENLLTDDGKLKGDKPITISEDGYVIDGHHRWYVAKKHNLKINATKVNLSATQVIQEMFLSGLAEQEDISAVRYASGGRVSKNYLNAQVPYSEYPSIFGDNDGDSVPNVDDVAPMNKDISEQVEEVRLSDEMKHIIDYRNDFEAMREKMVDTLEDIIYECGGKGECGIMSRTKTPYSIVNKLRRRSLTDVADLEKLEKKAKKKLKDKDLNAIDLYKGLTDVVGTMVVTPNKANSDKIRDAILDGRVGRVLEFEDMYKDSKAGYRAYHFLVAMEDNGKEFPIEVQVKTERIKKLSDLAHTLYKQGRINPNAFEKLMDLANKGDKGNTKAQKEFDTLMENPSKVEKIITTNKMKKGGILDIYDYQDETPQEISNRQEIDKAIPNHYKWDLTRDDEDAMNMEALLEGVRKMPSIYSTRDADDQKMNKAFLHYTNEANSHFFVTEARLEDGNDRDEVYGFQIIAGDEEDADFEHNYMKIFHHQYGDELVNWKLDTNFHPQLLNEALKRYGYRNLMSQDVPLTSAFGEVIDIDRIVSTPYSSDGKRNTAIKNLMSYLGTNKEDYILEAQNFISTYSCGLFKAEVGSRLYRTLVGMLYLNSQNDNIDLDEVMCINTCKGTIINFFPTEIGVLCIEDDATAIQIANLLYARDNATTMSRSDLELNPPNTRKGGMIILTESLDMTMNDLAYLLPNGIAVIMCYVNDFEQHFATDKSQELFNKSFTLTEKYRISINSMLLQIKKK